jgi:hypothetical protein
MLRRSTRIQSLRMGDAAVAMGLRPSAVAMA